jgi:hypothetical protein
MEGTGGGHHWRPPGRLSHRQDHQARCLDDKEIKVTNPDYEDWLAANQQILNLLLASVPKDVLVQIATKKTAAVA